MDVVVRDDVGMAPLPLFTRARLGRVRASAGVFHADGEPGAFVRVRTGVYARAEEWRSARPEIDGLSEVEVREALEGLDPLWDELFPAEQARIVQLLVERVEVGQEGVDIRLRVDGLARLVHELGGMADDPRRAA